MKNRISQEYILRIFSISIFVLLIYKWIKRRALFSKSSKSVNTSWDLWILAEWQLKPWGCYLKSENTPHQVSTNMSWHMDSESKNLISSNYDSDTTVTELLKHESKILLSQYLCLSFFNIFIIVAPWGLWRFNKLTPEVGICHGKCAINVSFNIMNAVYLNLIVQVLV